MNIVVHKNLKPGKENIKYHNEQVKNLMANKTQEKLTIRQKIDERRRQAKLAQPYVPQPITVESGPEPFIMNTGKINHVFTEEPKITDILNQNPLNDAALSSYESFILGHLKNESIMKGMKITKFKDFIKDANIALIANSSILLQNEFGKEIDKHDIVIRFNSFLILPKITGKKTTIHISIYLQDINLNVPVPIRIILAPTFTKWKTKIETLKKNDQNAILEFYSYIDLVHHRLTDYVLTSGFVTLLLLKVLGGYKRISLYGFDFYEHNEKSILRHSAGLKYPIATVHNYDMEKQILFNTADVVDKKFSNFIYYENRAL